MHHPGVTHQVDTWQLITGFLQSDYQEVLSRGLRAQAWDAVLRPEMAGCMTTHTQDDDTSEVRNKFVFASSMPDPAKANPHVR